MTSVQEAPRRQVRKRVLVSVGTLALLVVALLPAYARGTVYGIAPVNPKSYAQGPITQLLKASSGQNMVRCAGVLEQPIEQVWRTVTDYRQFPRVFPWVEQTEASLQPDGRYRLSGTMSTPIGSLPVELSIRYEETRERRVASWDAPSGRLRVNRGSWTLEPLGPARTLVIYSLEADVRGVPSFLVNSFLIQNLYRAVEALEARNG